MNSGDLDLNYPSDGISGRRGKWINVPCGGIGGKGHGSICEAGMYQKLMRFCLVLKFLGN